MDKLAQFIRGRCEGLKFGKDNAKLDAHTFSLPAGHACPHAKECLAKADRETGRITDGKATRFRCFSASQEAIFPSVRAARWHNFEALRGLTRDGMVRLILTSLPSGATVVRIHVSGDFFSQAYFDAWCAVARQRPGILFYAYTKSLPYWCNRLGAIPANFQLTASLGGKHDELARQHGLRTALVVEYLGDAAEIGRAHV